MQPAKDYHMDNWSEDFQDLVCPDSDSLFTSRTCAILQNIPVVMSFTKLIKPGDIPW